MSEQRLINANALMEVIKAHDYPLADSIGSIDNGMFTVGIQQAVDEAPTVDAKPVVHGRWITTRTMLHDGELYCSVCEGEAPSEHGRYTYIHSDFCPNCGADMRGGENG